MYNERDIPPDATFMSRKVTRLERNTESHYDPAEAQSKLTSNEEAST